MSDIIVTLAAALSLHDSSSKLPAIAVPITSPDLAHGTYHVNKPIIGYKSVKCSILQPGFVNWLRYMTHFQPAVNYDQCIVTLTIPQGSQIVKTGSIATPYFRADQARVDDIQPLHDTPGQVVAARSIHRDDYHYAVGRPQKPFNPDHKNSYASGIHFYATRELAENY